MKLGLVYARSRNGVIGKDGVLPWHLPEDLAHFKRVTMGQPVIMGRRTWESIPAKFRPLPGRVNIVVSRQGDWQPEGAMRAPSLEEALKLCPAEAATAWVIGGAGLFADAMRIADVLELTEIDADYEGDVFAPPLDSRWHERSRERHVGANGIPFSFVTYTTHS